MKHISLFDYWPVDSPGTKQALVFCAALLFVYSIAIYSKSLQNDFVWDSEAVILEDPMVRDMANIPGFFIKPLVLGKTGDVGDGLTISAINYYRPLLSTLHTIEYAFFQSTPYGYKALNLLLNGLVVVLGFLIIRQITQSLPIAFLATLIYASTLGRAEAVYWVYSDSHILSALFSLAAFWAYLNNRRWAALVLMAVGLLFQEGGVVLPLLLLTFEATRSSAQPLWGRLLRIIPFGLLSLLYLVARHFIVGQVPISSLGYWSLVKAAGYQGWEYARIFLFPDGPATIYLYQEGMFSAGGFASITGASALLFFIVTGLILWRFRKSECFWYLWFFSWIVISFNIGVSGDYLMADKGLYLSSLGLSVLTVRLLLSAERFQSIGVIVIFAVFLFNSIQIYARADSWVDTPTYLGKALEFEPEFDLALLEGGNSAYASGQFELASDYYLRLLRLRPELLQSVSKPYVESILRHAEALTNKREFKQAILILDDALTILNGSSELYNGLGVVHYLAGNHPEAEKNWKLALQLAPDNLEAEQNLNMLDVSN